MYALWKEMGKGAASNNLRQALYVARGTLAHLGEQAHATWRCAPSR